MLVEQNVALALAIADRAYVTENGQIVMEGSGTELLHRDEVRRAYLSV